jgi:hypothetical protein
MAPSFKVEIFKHFGTSRPWANTYLLDAADLLDAQGMAESIVTAETQLHYTVVQYDRLLVSSTTPLDSVFEVTPLATTGQRDSSGVQFLPLFNTVRVDFHAIGGGRPSRKYYRAPIGEFEQTDGLLETATLASWQSLIDSFLASLAGAGVAWVDPQSQVIDAGSVQRPVQMRQLHRKRRRSV